MRIVRRRHVGRVKFIIYRGTEPIGEGETDERSFPKLCALLTAQGYEAVLSNDHIANLNAIDHGERESA